MALERRKDSRHRYYARTRRVGGGRFVREYIGSGFVAEAAAMLEAVRREDAALERARQREERAEKTRCKRVAKKRERQEQERLDGLEREVDAFCRQVEEGLRQALEAAGYYRHARSEWRKRPRKGTRKITD